MTRIDYRELAHRQMGAQLGHTLIPDDDPAELFHEASGAKRRYQLRDKQGAVELEHEEALRDVVQHSGKRHPYVPQVALSEPRLPDVGLSRLFEARRTERRFAPGGLTEAQLSAMLYAAYGRVESSGSTPRRTVPSGGALFPLDIYLGCRTVDGLEPGLYRYEPSIHVAEAVDPDLAVTDLVRSLVHPEVGDGAACLFIITSIFWRSRFKYGLRGYRFVLIEAGHVMQNIMLAGAALGVGVAPLGGFRDQELSEMLRMDGVAEAPLYVAAAGPLRKSAEAP